LSDTDKSEGIITAGTEFIQEIYDFITEAVIVIDNNGNIVYWDNAAEKIFGYKSREVIRKPVHNLLAPEKFSEKSFKGFKKFQETGKGAVIGKTLEIIARKKDGTELPIELSVSAVKIEGKWNAIGVVKGIRERKWTEETVQYIALGISGTTSEEIFRSLVIHLAKALQVDYVLVGKLEEKEGTVVKTIAVSAGGELVDNIEYELSGTPCEKVVEKDLCIFPNNVQELFPKDHLLVDMEIESYAGHPLKDSEGKTLGLIVALGKKPFKNLRIIETMLKIFAVRASTELERMQVEEEKKALWDQFLQSQKLESVGRLARGVAHDFNNILTGILGYTDIAMMETLKEHPAYRRLQFIEEACEKASALIAQLLAFSRNQVLELKACNISSIVNNMGNMLSGILKEKIALKLKTDPRVKNIMADMTQMEQILMNLAVNAKHAMPDGGSIIIETKEVELGGEFIKTHQEVEPGSYVRLSVSDTGIGMSEEVKENILEPFFTTREKGEGTGLGLSTVFGIVKQHNGYIYVESEPGKGTVFNIYLPAI
jgi:PAS domain S-box-containing protein